MEQEQESGTLRSSATLFGSYLAEVPSKKRTSERGELIRYFFENARVGWKSKRPLGVAYVGMKLSALSLDDLYAFKSMCEDRGRTGYPWSKYFWGALKEQPWQKEN